jgi:excisionase family DNA binding protein
VNTQKRPKPHDPPDLLTPAEAAALLRVSLRTIQRWTADGTLPSAVRFGATVRYTRADVLKLERPQ